MINGWIVNEKICYLIILLCLSCSGEPKAFKAIHFITPSVRGLGIQYPATPEHQQKNTLELASNFDDRPQIIQIVEDYPRKATVKVLTIQPLSMQASLIIAHNSRAMLSEHYQLIKILMTDTLLNSTDKSENPDDYYFVIEYNGDQTKIIKKVSWLQRFSLWIDDLKD